MPRKHVVLIVDDDNSFRFTLSEILKKDGYDIIAAADAYNALECVKKERLDLIIMDIKMPGKNGLEAISDITQINDSTPIIILTAYGTENVNLGTIKESAYVYLTKPFDMEKLRSIIKTAIESRAFLEEESSYADKAGFEEIIGTSPVMCEVKDLIRKVSKSNVTVLIQGESGTGKELAAKAIYFLSQRSKKPFIPIMCSAIPETLLESELFGYEKGAFTDAHALKIGKFEIADQGTLFLDEIGDMSLLLQAKLLRVLEEKEIERLGGIKPIKVDVRIIAATNKDLLKEVKEARFRDDLFYRLNIVSLYLPPLRKRKEDIPALVESFIKIFNKTLNRNIKSISIGALEFLIDYSWPGNIRELENVLQNAMVIETGDILSKSSFSFIKEYQGSENSHSADTADESLSLEESLKKATQRIEKEVILKVLNKNNMNREKAAHELGISRKTLYNKMKNYGVI